MKDNLKGLNDEIVKVLNIDCCDRVDKSNLIPKCDHYMNVIYIGKGGICVYCRTMFKVLSSLFEHQQKSCKIS